jgi:hypothetical protein
VLVLDQGAPVAMSGSASAYPSGHDDFYARAYDVVQHQLTWTLGVEGMPTVDLVVHWQGVWVANGDEVYGCIDMAVASAYLPDGDPDGALAIEATFGSPVFTAAHVADGEGWTAWAATLPVAFRIRSDRAGELVRGWLLEADGQSHPQFA